jgi:hypothetical protein
MFLRNTDLYVVYRTLYPRRYKIVKFKIVFKSSRLHLRDLHFGSEDHHVADLESCPVPSAGGFVL